MSRTLLAACALILLPLGAAQAHHSFAAFFDGGQSLKLIGKVTDFRFTNPHGTIGFDVTGPDGKVKHWAAETNSPAVLMRRGWTRNSIKPGDIITIDGWPSRDGKPYMRLREARDASGRLIGQAAFTQSDDK